MMRKRPASSHGDHTPSVDDKCWSCVAGGFGEFSNSAQNSYAFHGCCRSCCSGRTCCRKFNRETTLLWCSECQEYLAQWCSKCVDAAVLEKRLCRKCNARRIIGDVHEERVQYVRSDGTCWSCVAGEFGKYSNKAQSEQHYRGCCRSCFSHRICCGVFNQSLDILWCKQCKCYPATWHCDKSVLCKICKAKSEKAPTLAEGEEDNLKRLRSASTCSRSQQTPAMTSKDSASDAVCDTLAVVAPSSCGDHAPPLRCACGQLYNEGNVTRCHYCNTTFTPWNCRTCQEKYGLLPVCNKCFSRRQCACGSFVSGKTRFNADVADRCTVCHHYRAWICGDCREAGFKRRVCNSATCCNTVESKLVTLCPRSDNTRADFELDKMMKEDKRTALKVCDVGVCDLGGKRFTGDFSKHDTWTVIVPRPFCTFGELRHILIHYYRVHVPEHVCFTDGGRSRTDDELLPLPPRGIIIFNSKPPPIEVARPWSLKLPSR